jgi:hypothetical protein
MDSQLLLEEKHDSLQKRLDENLRRKHVLEFRINQEFEELKRLEVLLEKVTNKSDRQNK